jgi:hypothetical protein
MLRYTVILMILLPTHAFAGTTESTLQGAVRLMTASIRLMGQSKSMRSIIDATQPEQRRGLA